MRCWYKLVEQNTPSTLSHFEIQVLEEGLSWAPTPFIVLNDTYRSLYHFNVFCFVLGTVIHELFYHTILGDIMIAYIWALRKNLVSNRPVLPISANISQTTWFCRHPQEVKSLEFRAREVLERWVSVQWTLTVFLHSQ